MLAFTGLLIAAAAVAWGAASIAAELRRSREQAAQSQVLAIAQAFAPAIAASQNDPRVLLTWQPLAKSMRALFPEAFAALDRASAAAFPFPPDRLQAAHAQWTAEWLAWERAHDAEYKARAVEAQSSPARADAVEREKLETYQRRYEEYIRVARALQALIQP